MSIFSEKNVYEKIGKYEKIGLVLFFRTNVNGGYEWNRRP